eukprot:248589-Amphidinium_carterae.1
MEHKGSDCGDTNVVTVVAARREISADVHVATIMFIMRMSQRMTWHLLAMIGWQAALSLSVGTVRHDSALRLYVELEKRMPGHLNVNHKRKMSGVTRRSEVGVRALPGPSDLRTPRGTAGLPQYGPAELEEQVSSDDSEGTYATPQWADETPTFEEDLTWEQEDLEEEAREVDEVTS